MPAVEDTTTGSRRITRGVCVEIAKPLGISWTDLGALLNDRRSVIHRLLQAGVLYIASEHQRDPEWKGTALAGIKAELASYQEWCRAAAEKQSDPVQKAMLERRASMVISSGILDAASKACFEDYKKWRKNRNNRLPSAKKGAPIPIRSGKWLLSREGNGYTLAVSLIGASEERAQPGKVRVALRPSTGKHHAALGKIADGVVKAGNCQLILDDSARRKYGASGKWFAVLNYSEELPNKPPTASADRVLIVHRGQRNFLFALTNDGQTRRLDGGRFAATRLRLRARMNSVRRISATERGSGACGHGRSRRYETYDALDSAIADVTKTFCQQAAAWVAKLAREFGCGVVYIEDYGGQEQSEERGIRRFVDHFPYYQLKECIKWVAKRDQAFELREYAASYISQTCPTCGNADDRQHNRRTGVFHCSMCSFERAADYVATLNAARVATIDVSAIDKQLAQQRRLAEQMRAVESGEVVEGAEVESRSQSASQVPGKTKSLRDRKKR